MTGDPPPGAGVSGNTFHGPAPFQLGDNNVQNIHFHGPPASEPTRRALVLAGAAQTTRRDLAAAIRRDWAAARRQFFEGPATAEPEGWLGLLAWLRDLDDLSPADLGGRTELIDHRLRDDSLPADLKLLHLLGWLDPEGEATYRGHRVTVRVLVDVCLGAREPMTFEDLCRYPLLEALSRFRELNELSAVQDTWDDRQRQFERIHPLHRSDVKPANLLLLSSLDDAHARQWLRKRAGMTPGPAAPVDWYDTLLDRAGAETPFGHAVRVLLGESAAEEAEANQELRRAERQQRRQWKTQEKRQRELAAYLAQLITPENVRLAILRAVAWHGMWGGFTAVGYWLVWGRTGVFPATAAVYFQIALLTVLSLSGQIPRVRRLGSAYRPPITNVAKWLPSSAAGLRRAFGRLALLGLFLFAQDLLAEVSLVPYFEKPNFTHTGATLATIPFVLLAFAALAYVWFTGDKLRAWDEDHRQVMQRFGQSAD
ncbi:hypothetical protein AB0A74_16200 [Saccharothrix sp. NPDC042600]|uniref:hypothetical protein n=1 Tax=Saccharothrix TaxID=2071 RepID=UPI0033C1D152|nr:hypothetical protein GCM10017745_45590 [Saccharothrix mutabilis subsp. capreolus]